MWYKTARIQLNQRQRRERSSRRGRQWLMAFHFIDCALLAALSLALEVQSWTGKWAWGMVLLVVHVVAFAAALIYVPAALVLAFKKSKKAWATVRVERWYIYAQGVAWLVSLIASLGGFFAGPDNCLAEFSLGNGGDLLCWDRIISLVLSLFNLAALVWWHLHLGRLTVLAAQLGNTAEDIDRTPVPRLVVLRAGTIGVEQDGGSVERVDLTAAYGVEEEGQRERVEPFETPVSTSFSGDASIGRMREIGSSARRELYAGQGDAPPAYEPSSERPPPHPAAAAAAAATGRSGERSRAQTAQRERRRQRTKHGNEGYAPEMLGLDPSPSRSPSPSPSPPPVPPKGEFERDKTQLELEVVCGVGSSGP